MDIGTDRNRSLHDAPSNTILLMDYIISWKNPPLSTYHNSTSIKTSHKRLSLFFPHLNIVGHICLTSWHYQTFPSDWVCRQVGDFVHNICSKPRFLKHFMPASKAVHEKMRHDDDAEEQPATVIAIANHRCTQSPWANNVPRSLQVWSYPFFWG